MSKREINTSKGRWRYVEDDLFNCPIYNGMAARIRDYFSARGINVVTKFEYIKSLMYGFPVLHWSLLISKSGHDDVHLHIPVTSVLGIEGYIPVRKK